MLDVVPLMVLEQLQPTEDIKTPNFVLSTNCTLSVMLSAKESSQAIAYNSKKALSDFFSSSGLALACHTVLCVEP